MIAKKDRIFLERHSTRLSFAVFLLDDYSMGKPIGRVDVFLKGRKEKPIKNLSSYYLFLDLPDDSYIVQVRSDYYFDEDLDTTAGLDPKNPVIITLKPKPSYPFPPGATLIRGMAYDSAGKTVSDAKVRVKGKDVENKTTKKGEFVLYFGPLTEDEIIEEDGKRFVKWDGDKIIHLEVDLFNIGAEFEDNLNNGIISEKMKDIFKTKGFPLSENAMVIKEKENEWVITNEKKFIVRKENGKLNIYIKPIELEAEEGKTTSVVIK